MNKQHMRQALERAQHHLDIAAHCLIGRGDADAALEHLWEVSHWADRANAIGRSLQEDAQQ